VSASELLYGPFGCAESFANHGETLFRVEEELSLSLSSDGGQDAPREDLGAVFLSQNLAFFPSLVSVCVRERESMCVREGEYVCERGRVCVHIHTYMYDLHTCIHKKLSVAGSRIF
jgi:hypothetical protein